MADKDDDVVQPKKSNLPVIISAVCALAAVGMGAKMMLGGGHSEAKAASEEHESGGEGGGKRSESGPTVRLADFVVRLRNPEAERYVRISFEAELGSDRDKETVAAHTAQIRDGFISYLSDRTMEDLRGSEGLEQIKAGLVKKLIQLVPGVKVRGLYITDFVSQ